VRYISWVILSKDFASSYLSGNRLWRTLHPATNLLCGLLEVPSLSNLALHLSGSGTLGRTTLLLGSLGNDVAG
jgi:hypothetical protein